MPQKKDWASVPAKLDLPQSLNSGFFPQALPGMYTRHHGSNKSSGVLTSEEPRFKHVIGAHERSKAHESAPKPHPNRTKK
jgi:hypothetical protein